MRQCGFIFIAFALLFTLCACSSYFGKLQDVEEPSDEVDLRDAEDRQVPTGEHAELPNPIYAWERAPMICYEGRIYMASLGKTKKNLSGLEKIGSVESTISDDQVPTEELQSNCGYIGADLFVLEGSADCLYLLSEGKYLAFRYDGTTTTSRDPISRADDDVGGETAPGLTCQGKFYLYTGNILDVNTVSTLKFVGVIRNVAPDGGSVSGEFSGNQDVLGMQLYKDPADDGHVYLLKDGNYYICYCN